ncbi:uncharacterized protein [Neodiprion pinetum]|uniref:uncharacterized protein LOC124180384 n=1 Tax=Neodiprion fabricii TaxID=2872261 RepID=UPI00076FA2A3|nr:uncharacterized protein LOC124180384 [Neodiprion fabricii]XP_046478178.1 uncharacterized protein LOC124217007 [Neodiprion pinetum]
MADNVLSLDDIIKKSKISAMKGRGSRRGINRGTLRTNVSSRGRGGPVIADARFKIIQKNREKLTDARDKLAQIAKQSDARLKLDKLRATHLKTVDLPLSGISRQTGLNGRITLTTNKLHNKTMHPIPATNYLAPGSRAMEYRAPPMVETSYADDMEMNFNDDYMMDSTPLRRTVNNEYVPVPPPPPPSFNLSPTNEYTWVKLPGSSLGRMGSSRPVEVQRPRDFKIVARTSMGKPMVTSKSDWSFGSKARTILTEDTINDRYLDIRGRRDVGVKSRLDSLPNKPRTMGILSRPKSSSNSTSVTTGYRIVVSNLQANVTQEDIKELFEDVGELLVSRLVRPGTAEVIYKTLKDATKAVETYHNRQLDGHPMKCLLVNPRPKNNPTGPAVRPLPETRRSASSSYVQPSLGAVHRALFDD